MVLQQVGKPKRFGKRKRSKRENKSKNAVNKPKEEAVEIEL